MSKRITPVAIAALLTAMTIAFQLGNERTVAPEGPDRPADQTFLTFPEWYLVYSPNERANVFATRPPSEFPYLGHVRQLWQSYGAVTDATRSLPPNYGYHAMIAVIATSTTIEYGIEAAYELFVGRVTEALRPGVTVEDRYAAQVAREYVDFIRVRPWYEFDYVTRLRRLWSLPVSRGTSLLRGLERRYFLTSEYGAKAVYAQVLAALARIGYATPNTHTRVTIESPSAVLDLPRYQEFTAAALQIARSGGTFRRIAGNDGEIVVSALSRVNIDSTAQRVLFTQPILTDPGVTRFVLAVRVADLAPTLRRLDARDIEIEHIYDY